MVEPDWFEPSTSTMPL